MGETLTGTAGRDIFYGGLGSDFLRGFDDQDIAAYRDSAVGVSVNLFSNTAHFGTAAGDTFESIEGVFGSRHNDTLIGDDDANFLRGKLGNDRLEGGGGDDRLEGGTGNDELLGGHGSDRLNGGLGHDILNGGDGIDTAVYRDATSGAAINTRNGQMLGSAQGDTLIDIENLVGTNFGDSLITGDGNNKLFGLDGNDFLDGGSGDDTLEGGAGGDFLHGSVGIDTASYRSSDAAVNVNLGAFSGSGGHAEGDTLSWINNVLGSQFGDTLTGDILENRLRGKEGDDTLSGGEGRDTLIGDEGADSFIFTQRSDHASNTTSGNQISRYAGSTHDMIKDFTPGEDLLVFDSSEFTGDVFVTNQISDLNLADATASAFALFGSHLFYLRYASPDDFANGVTELTHLAKLNGISTLTSDDFLFI
ncbi:MAG: calcium-binding protein [Pseudomonadota bacterium]